MGRDLNEKQTIWFASILAYDSIALVLEDLPDFLHVMRSKNTDVGRLLI